MEWKFPEDLVYFGTVIYQWNWMCSFHHQPKISGSFFACFIKTNLSFYADRFAVINYKYNNFFW